MTMTPHPTLPGIFVTDVARTQEENMNTTIRVTAGAAWMVAAVAMGVATAYPSYADNTYPPPRYDIGGETEIEVLNNATAMGLDAPLVRVPFGEAKAACDRINLERYGEPYPSSVTADGSTLLGCTIINVDRSDPVIVYTYDWNDSAVRLLRHEYAHLLGWSADHRRN